MPFDDTAIFGGPGAAGYDPNAILNPSAATMGNAYGDQLSPAVPSVPAPAPRLVARAPVPMQPPMASAPAMVGGMPAQPPVRAPPPMAAPQAAPQQQPSFATFLQRLLGAEPNNPDQNLATRGSLGAGLSAVAQNWNKPGLAAFAGGAGAAIEGGEKTMLALITQAIHARQVGDMAAYRRAYLAIIDQAKNRTPFEMQRAR